MKKILKIFVSIIILCLLFHYIDIDESLKVLSKINTKIFIYCVFIYIAGQVISAVKWGEISNFLGFKISLFNYIKYYFKGMFYNTFLPTNIGGDIIKISYLQKTSDLKQSAISVVSDRLSGLFVLIVLAFLGTFMTPLTPIIKYCIWTGTAVSTLVLAISAYLCKFSGKSLIKIFALSIIFHTLVIIIHILIGHALNLNINNTYYLILYPLTAIMASLPISLNGIGIKEAGYMYLLNQISIDTSQSIVFVLCWNLVILTASLFGAVFFIKKKSP